MNAQDERLVPFRDVSEKVENIRMASPLRDVEFIGALIAYSMDLMRCLEPYEQKAVQAGIQNIIDFKDTHQGAKN